MSDLSKDLRLLIDTGKVTVGARGVERSLSDSSAIAVIVANKGNKEVTSNIPFFAKCFQGTMDEVVMDAKTEVENAIQHKINTLGLNALHEQNRLLENK